MDTTKLPEVWLRGPLPEIPSLLQPVAHSLLEAREEVNVLMQNFPENLLWNKVAGLASPGFHLQHMKGVIERLFTYARGEALTQEQLTALKAEGDATKTKLGTSELVNAFNQQIDIALEQLKATDEKDLTEYRSVGRSKLPSTILGLLFHSAEHVMRHVGQLLVTVRVLRTQTN